MMGRRFRISSSISCSPSSSRILRENFLSLPLPPHYRIPEHSFICGQINGWRVEGPRDIQCHLHLFHVCFAKLSLSLAVRVVRLLWPLRSSCCHACMNSCSYGWVPSKVTALKGLRLGRVGIRASHYSVKG